MKKNVWKGVPKSGRPVQLSVEGELELLEVIFEFLKIFAHVTDEMIIRECVDIAGRMGEGETEADVVQRLNHCGGAEWYDLLKLEMNERLLHYFLLQLHSYLLTRFLFSLSSLTYVTG